MLERSWTGHAPRVCRFGQRGSMPVRDWFPFAAIEDRKAGVTWAVLTAGFLLLRIRHAPLWAFGAALVDAVPILGTGAVLVPWSLIAFLQADTGRAFGLLALYAAATVIRTTLEPKLIGRQLGLDPLLTLAALYGGYRLWGIVGMLLAPILAVAAAKLVESRPQKS